MRKLALAVFLFGITGVSLAAGSRYSGTYEGDEVVVEIKDVGAGRFAGTIRANGQMLQFTAREASGALEGLLTVDEEEVEFRATLDGTALTFSTKDESHVLIKQGVSTHAAGKRPESNSAGSTTPPVASAAQTRPLRVNQVSIDEGQVCKFEQEHRMRIPRGDFWYDKISGAWGMEGGPTLGCTTPGMSLGGPLRADSSRGDTGVFINGRELPLQDVLGLQQLSVPVTRGRWWVDSAGNFGVDGNPAVLGNLFQFSQGRGGAYQRSTAGGYIGGDGQTSYFFDPETGSSVMTDQ